MPETTRYLYIFLDEAGNLDFTPDGTKYFILGAITKERPFHAYKELVELKYDLAEYGHCIERFHASEDTQHVRNNVFEIIENNLDGVRIDSLIIEKTKTGSALRAPDQFYPRMLCQLLNYILMQHTLENYAEIIIFTDSLPIKKKKDAIIKSIKQTMADILPPTAKYRIHHHDSKSNLDLQIADYCTWAIHKKWTHGDGRSYQRIRPAVKSEFDIFRNGVIRYY